MTDPYRARQINVSEVGVGPPGRVDAGRLWAGGVATAVVAGMIAVTGVLVARALFDVVVVAPEGAGAWGDNARYVATAVVLALLATALMQILVAFTPRPMRFFGWIAALVIMSVTLAPVAAEASLGSRLYTAVLNLVLGIAVASLTAGSTRAAIRARRLRPRSSDDDGWSGA